MAERDRSKLLAVALLAVALASCGGDGSNGSEASPRTTGTQTTAAARPDQDPGDFMRENYEQTLAASSDACGRRCTRPTKRS
jgi:hypothetical protein